MRRRSLIVAVIVAACCGLVPAAAGAWTLPSNAGAAPGSSVASYCPAFPTDPAQPASGAEVVLGGGVTVAANTWTNGTSATLAAGEYQVSQGNPGWNSAQWELQAQDAAGIWQTIASGVGVGGQFVYVPAGPARFAISNTTASTVAELLAPVTFVGQTGRLEQYDAVACLNAAAGRNQAHTDSGALLTELQTIDSDVKAGPTVTTASTVQLSPADRQMIADAANGAHDDLWELGGGLLAVWVLVTIARAVWL